MIGSRITYTLAGGAELEVLVRPADLFAAEDTLGFDPLERFGAANEGRLSTSMLRALVAVTWAAHRREPDPDATLDAFTALLESMPAADVGADAGRPTLAAASGE